MTQQVKEAQQLQQQLEQIEALAKQHMTQEAVARYGNLKAVHTEKAIQSVMIIAGLANEGKLSVKLNDEQYKTLLRQLTPEKKEFSMRRK